MIRSTIWGIKREYPLGYGMVVPEAAAVWCCAKATVGLVTHWGHEAPNFASANDPAPRRQEASLDDMLRPELQATTYGIHPAG